MIPKPGRGERPLGIPTVQSRVVRTAAKLVLEPSFEADFDALMCSAAAADPCLPLLMMAANPQRAGLAIADGVVQLRCQQCCQHPASVTLLEDGAARARGAGG
jgi:hypothetical protein